MENVRRLSSPSRPRSRSGAQALIRGLLGLVTLLTVVVAGLIVSHPLWSPSVRLEAGMRASEVPLNTPLMVKVAGLGVSLKQVSLLEETLGFENEVLSSRYRAGELSQGTFIPADGEALLNPDARYTFKVKGETTTLGGGGIERVPFEQIVTFTTARLPLPKLSETPFAATPADPLVIEFAAPLADLVLATEPAQEFTTTLSPDGRMATVSFPALVQGTEFTLVVKEAVGVNGLSLPEPQSQQVKVAPPLKIAKTTPRDGSVGVSTSTAVEIRFDSPVRDREAVAAHVQIKPAISGRIEWPDDQTLRFVPGKPFNYDSRVTLSLAGGPAGLRSTEGGYLNEPVEVVFRTMPPKKIDVNLTTQSMTLFENGVPVRSMQISSGKEGSPTNPGTYNIYAKIPLQDMRGPDYHVKDVPSILVFDGDYTIHGNYWATKFGEPSSRGCVGLPVDTAAWVYSWAPIGTQVAIHF